MTASLLGGVTYVGDRGSSYAEFDGADEAGFRMLAVAPAAQGLGAGAALVAACIELARRDGKRRLTLLTTDGMAAAHRLYARFGFRREPASDMMVASGLQLRSFVLDLEEDRMATVVSDLPRPVRVIENMWIPLSDGTRLAAKIWLPEDAERDPVPAVLEYLPYRKRDGTAGARRAAAPYLAGHGYAGGARRPARPRRLRRHPRGRVHRRRAGRRRRGDRLARGAALVHRRGRACTASPGAASTRCRSRRCGRRR